MHLLYLQLPWFYNILFCWPGLFCLILSNIWYVQKVGRQNEGINLKSKSSADKKYLIWWLVLEPDFYPTPICMVISSMLYFQTSKFILFVLKLAQKRFSQKLSVSFHNFDKRLIIKMYTFASLDQFVQIRFCKGFAFFCLYFYHNSYVVLKVGF